MSTLDSSSRNSRLDFRLSAEHKRLIEQAANICGQTISEFALTKLLPVAQETIEHSQRTQLSARDRDLFLKMLDAPPEPNSALRKAAKRYRQRDE